MLAVVLLAAAAVPQRALLGSDAAKVAVLPIGSSLCNLQRVVDVLQNECNSDQTMIERTRSRRLCPPRLGLPPRHQQRIDQDLAQVRHHARHHREPRRRAQRCPEAGEDRDCDRQGLDRCRQDERTLEAAGGRGVGAAKFEEPARSGVERQKREVHAHARRSSDRQAGRLERHPLRHGLADLGPGDQRQQDGVRVGELALAGVDKRGGAWVVW